MNQILQHQGSLAGGTTATGTSAGQLPQNAQLTGKKGYSRNNQNLGAPGGTAGPLLQGGAQKQQMNFTSYESGFGAGTRGSGANGPATAGQASSNLVGKSSRAIHNEFGHMNGATAGGQNNTRNGLISSNALIKSQQHIGGVGPAAGNNIYSNMHNQSSALAQKAAMNASSTQQKFLSKSPNPQNKLMTNTNYGKFKAIPTAQNQMAGGAAVNSLYSRGQGALGTGHNNGQYLPKLGGAGVTAGLAGSQTQLPQYNQGTNKHAASSANMPPSQLHYQQQHLLQQSSSSQLSSHHNLPQNVGSKGPFNGQNGGAPSYQQQVQRSKQSQGQPAGGAPQASSQQSAKAAAHTSGNNQNLGGMQSAQALNFRQNLNLSLQQIHTHAKGGAGGVYRNTSQTKK